MLRCPLFPPVALIDGTWPRTHCLSSADSPLGPSPHHPAYLHQGQPSALVLQRLRLALDTDGYRCHAVLVQATLRHARSQGPGHSKVCAAAAAVVVTVVVVVVGVGVDVSARSRPFPVSRKLLPDGRADVRM